MNMSCGVLIRRYWPQRNVIFGYVTANCAMDAVNIDRTAAAGPQLNETRPTRFPRAATPLARTYTTLE